MAGEKSEKAMHDEINKLPENSKLVKEMLMAAYKTGQTNGRLDAISRLIQHLRNGGDGLEFVEQQYEVLKKEVENHHGIIHSSKE